jgi:hypothetical protein
LAEDQPTSLKRKFAIDSIQENLCKKSGSDSGANVSPNEGNNKTKNKPMSNKRYSEPSVAPTLWSESICADSSEGITR